MLKVILNPTTETQTLPSTILLYLQSLFYYSSHLLHLHYGEIVSSKRSCNRSSTVSPTTTYSRMKDNNISIIFLFYFSCGRVAVSSVCMVTLVLLHKYLLRPGLQQRGHFWVILLFSPVERTFTALHTHKTKQKSF